MYLVIMELTDQEQGQDFFLKAKAKGKTKAFMRLYLVERIYAIVLCGSMKATTSWPVYAFILTAYNVMNKNFVGIIKNSLR